MEITQIKNNTYYIQNNTNIGIYKINDSEVYLIDTGNDSDCGKKILKLLNEKNWQVKAIINTHSNADHCGGNKIIQDKTNCQILANKIESSIINYPILEPSFLYGGFPFKDLRNKFLEAKPSMSMDIQGNLPEELEVLELPGHFFHQIGIKTKDNIYFLGDALANENIITKYHIFFIYDVKSYLETLDYLSTLQGEYYVLSHNEITNDLSHLIKLNIDKITEISNKILDFCKTPNTFETILKHLFDEYNLSLNANQYVLIGSTIKSFLSYLYNESLLKIEYIDNLMLWSTND